MKSERFLEIMCAVSGIGFVLALVLMLMTPTFAASSERIVPPMDKKSQECREKYWDHTFIAQALQAGKTREWLIMAAESSLPPDHLAKVLPLIDEAVKAESPTEWLNSYWIPCMQ